MSARSKEAPIHFNLYSKYCLTTQKRVLPCKTIQFPYVMLINYCGWIDGYTRQAFDARLTKCTIPRLYFISINIFTTHVYALP